MHSLGNDFVMLDLITQNLHLHTAHIKKIADRNFGIGCDQVITIEPPIRKDSDFFYRNFNADGREVEQCGNGARCAARFVLDSGLASKNKLSADCIAGNISLLVKNKNQVSVNMGKVRSLELNRTVVVDNRELVVHLVSVGNPHVITFVDDVSTAPVKKIGAILAKSDLFPNGANVSFVELIPESVAPEEAHSEQPKTTTPTSNKVRARVYERGVGETLACGSAACAIVAVSHKLGLCSEKTSVEFKRGALEITLGAHQNIYLAGPTTSVFNGYFRL
jgi:diaminopimelate epimerase